MDSSSPTLPVESTELRSFDGAVVERAWRARPDRYRMLELDVGGGPRIARGGGYSYAAASFGGGSLVLDMSRFDRILRLDDHEVEVEAGVTLGRLLEVTLPRGLWLPVLPGHPGITVGGCIAANVHGKNPAREGTFVRWVRSLSLFHPGHGTLKLVPGDPLFDLTCGGLGLTGVIVSAVLALEPVSGGVVSLVRRPVSSVEEAVSLMEAWDGHSAFCYSWHDPVPRARGHGRGFVFTGTIVPTSSPALAIPASRELDVRPPGRFPVPVFGWGTRLVTGLHWALERMRPTEERISLWRALFPLAYRPEYFRLYGMRGLAEYQILVRGDKANGLLAALRGEIERVRPPVVMLAVRPFRGTQHLLRYEGDGYCVTLDLARSPAGTAFLERLDALTVDVGGYPNIIKDSRLPAAIVRCCYPEYERFRDELRTFDPDRRFGSELSRRLDL